MNARPATLVWYEILEQLVRDGEPSHPRGMAIKELMHYSATIDLRYPVIVSPTRDLSYKFMAAEAAWILSGDDQVATIAPYNKRIANYSDDGVKFFGAYGPSFIGQISYVVEALVKDPDTRQAVMTIWRPNPPATKDVPCTVAVQFYIRKGKLHCIDTMRSSDVWLGWVYDVFNFAMMTYWVRKRLKAAYNIDVELGTLTIQAGSQHLYEENQEKALQVLQYDYWKRDITALHHIDAELATTGLDEIQLIQYLWHLADKQNLDEEWTNATLATKL